jgi:hypothetical protein
MRKNKVKIVLSLLNCDTDYFKLLKINLCPMGLPPVMSAVFLIAKQLVKHGRLGGISEMPLLPLRG